MSDTGVGGGSPAEATSDDTGTKFGLCCCVPNPKQMSGLQAIGDQYGFRPIPCAAGFGDPAIYGCVTGNRRWNRIDCYIKWLCIDTSTFPGTYVFRDLNGTMIMDNLNGSIATHTLAFSGSMVGIVPLNPASGGIQPLSTREAGPPDPTTETHAEWVDHVPTDPFHTNIGTYQTIDLSNPVDASTAKTGAESLALGVDLTMHPTQHAYRIQYPEDVSGGSFFQGPAGGDWPMCDWDVVDLILVWTPINGSYFSIADSSIVYTPPVATLTDLGDYGIGIGINNASASWNADVFYNVWINEWFGLNPGQSCCLGATYDLGATALGFTDFCASQGIDGSGNFLELWPPMGVDPTDAVTSANGSYTTVVIYGHATLGGNGCPCISDI
jgi:hypothetical protein